MRRRARRLTPEFFPLGDARHGTAGRQFASRRDLQFCGGCFSLRKSPFAEVEMYLSKAALTPQGHAEVVRK
jgi:hypothetical protein